MVSPLIGAEELAHALVTSAPTVLDVRWSLGGPPGLDEFVKGHIPGSQFVDLERELAGPPGPGRHPMPGREDFEKAMRAHGVSGDGAVVVYDSSTGASAARAWWLLRYFGHPDVRLLNGGYAAWVRSGGRVETGEAAAAVTGELAADPGHMPRLDADGAAAVARTGVLLDARAPARFRGEAEPVDAVAGHIPGARSLPATANVGPEGFFLEAGELRSRFRAAGADGDRTLGVYCGSGVTAAHEVLAAAVAGLPAALYVGSWSDWITDSRRPIATGDEPPDHAGAPDPAARDR